VLMLPLTVVEMWSWSAWGVCLRSVRQRIGGRGHADGRGQAPSSTASLVVVFASRIGAGLCVSRWVLRLVGLMRWVG
jgi:hypothetical protein